MRLMILQGNTKGQIREFDTAGGNHALATGFAREPTADELTQADMKAAAMRGAEAEPPVETRDADEGDGEPASDEGEPADDGETEEE